ncbi:Bax inhibitor-1/YccA family protein [Oecophyllibacter saccharovorans]|uniref:Bax inhibitor-1/YccA family protein n=1 Tax=Oecophyllibacter saccharovorans TaxID=2558360 RepID=UPI001141ECE4|nr:Bax inhibitor-1/YccA family protein [Oecophyllibacter saccharovorans]QDH15719.1 Bax inhibitor-1/YccA family protein [Oecophyllibacter saccharovorans]TPW36740.1 Bax inhibitor-1/YccA family protein [Oecophyllibacter saccharovorans]
MSNPYNYQSADQQAFGVMDAGLRAYMIRVFGWMTLGLVLSGLTAYVVAHSSLLGVFYHIVATPTGTAVTGMTALGWIAALSPLAFVLVLSFGVNRLSRQMAQGLFLLFSIVTGVSLSTLLLFYTGTSVMQTFFITASVFAAMALWGYVTKRSLVSWGSFLMMGLLGLLIASLVNIFLHSSAMATVISIIGVLLFTAFTAHDTQRIKLSYQQALAYMPPEEINKNSVYDALDLYLDFINLFQYLLQFTGNRSNSN